MHDLKSFAVSWHPSATFPHHSLKTVASFLRLRQYISWKELRIRFSLPPFSLVVQEGVTLLRKLAVFWHGLQSGEDLLEHWPFLHHNTNWCHYSQTDIGGLTCRLNLKALLTFGSDAQQLLMSSAKLAGQPLGMVNLWETPRQGQAAGLKWHFTANGMKQLLSFSKLFGHKVIPTLCWYTSS